MAHTINPEVVDIPVPGRTGATYPLVLYPRGEAQEVRAYYNGVPRTIGVLRPVGGDQYVAEVLQQRSAPMARDAALTVIVTFITSFK
jgi:hypothetical protein